MAVGQDEMFFLIVAFFEACMSCYLRTGWLADAKKVKPRNNLNQILFPFALSLNALGGGEIISYMAKFLAV